MKIHFGGIAKTSVGSFTEDTSSQTTGNSVNTIQKLRITYDATSPQLIRFRRAVVAEADDNGTARSRLSATIAASLLLRALGADDLDDQEAPEQAGQKQEVRDRRGVSDLQALEQSAEDVERDRLGESPSADEREGEDQIVDPDQLVRAKQDDHQDQRPQQRDRQVPDLLPGVRSVDAGRLEWLVRQAGEPGRDHQHHERR